MQEVEQVSSLIGDIYDAALDPRLWATVLGRARNVAFENVSYSGRLVDGPIPDVDTSRGESAALARALVRAEVRRRCN